MEVLRSCIYLDPLILENILEHCDDTQTLACAGMTTATLSSAARDVASDALLARLKRLRVLPLRHEEGAAHNPILKQLSCWSLVEASTVLWLRAEPASLVLSSSKPQRVSKVVDASGHGHDLAAPSAEHMPTFVPDALGAGVGALEFGGSSVLETQPFRSPLPQPLTIMIVARARGDTTLCDSLGCKSARFELCHGYPTASSPAHATPEVCISAHGVGADAPTQLLRGKTRSANAWHVYTAVFDGERSEVFVDGVREAGGRSVGGASLDGLRVGCDHTNTFFLRGAVAEIRVFSTHLAPEPRAQLEAALALRYGLVPSPSSPTSVGKAKRPVVRLL